MSEEEQEAIKKLKQEINKPVEMQEDKFNTFILFNIKDAKITLNLIDRLQKELKELQADYIELDKENRELKNADLTIVYMNGFYDGEQKWKDKIKNKTNELEKQCETELLTTWLESQIDILEELLKEN